MKTLPLLVITSQHKRNWNSKLPGVPHGDTRGRGLKHLTSSGGSSQATDPSNHPQGLNRWSPNGEMLLALPRCRLLQPLQLVQAAWQPCQPSEDPCPVCLPRLAPSGMAGTLPTAVVTPLAVLMFGACRCPRCLFMMSAEPYPSMHRESILLKWAGDAAHISVFLPQAAGIEISVFSAQAGLRSPFA